MKITVNVNVPSGTTCYDKNGTECEWRNRLDEGHDYCTLCGEVRFYNDDRGKCYDCLKACVIALEAGKEREDG